MIKQLVSSSFVVLMLCGPAFADSALPRSPTLQPPVVIEVAVKVGTSVRKHQLMLVDNECGEINEKTRDHEDRIRICLKPSVGKEVRMEVSWMTREADTELEIKSVPVLVRGSTLEIGSNAMRLSIGAK